MALDSSVAIASVFGPYMVIAGLWMLLFSANLMKIWSSLRSTPAAFFLMGAINLLLGLYIINQYNVWTWNKALLVTILGWVFLVRGLLALFLPQVLVKYTMTEASLAKVIGLVPFLWGLVLCWVAFA